MLAWHKNVAKRPKSIIVIIEDMAVRWLTAQIEVEFVGMHCLQIDYRSRVHISHYGFHVIKLCVWALWTITNALPVFCGELFAYYKAPTAAPS